MFKIFQKFRNAAYFYMKGHMSMKILVEKG